MGLVNYSSAIEGAKTENVKKDAEQYVCYYLCC